MAGGLSTTTGKCDNNSRVITAVSELGASSKQALLGLVQLERQSRVARQEVAQIQNEVAAAALGGSTLPPEALNMILSTQLVSCDSYFIIAAADFVVAPSQYRSRPANRSCSYVRLHLNSRAHLC